MITVVEYESVLEPQKKGVKKLESRPRLTVADCIEHSSADMAFWHNGRLIAYEEARNTVVSDGDIVAYAVYPGGVEVLLYLGAAAAVALITAAEIQKLQDELEEALANAQTQDPLGNGAYSYYGFRNSYRPEGEPLPVVYGTLRFAPPCINRSITGAPVINAFGGLILASGTETLNAQYAVSHGPILGLGTAKGDVYDIDSFNDLTSLVNAKTAADMRVNGLDASSFPGFIQWRTGLLNQTSITGLPGFVDVNDTGRSYGVDFPFINGTPDIRETDYPAGAYPAGDPGIIQDPDALRYFSIDLDDVADVVSVRMIFPEGLYGRDDNTGDSFLNSATFRIQYYETDSAGSRISDTILLPEFTVVEARTEKFSVDLTFPMLSAETFQAPNALGYGKFGFKDADATDYLAYWKTDAALASISPSGAYDTPFTLSCWMSGMVEYSDARAVVFEWIGDYSGFANSVLSQPSTDSYWAQYGYQSEFYQDGYGAISVCVSVDIDYDITGGTLDFGAFVEVAFADKDSFGNWRTDRYIGRFNLNPVWPPPPNLGLIFGNNNPQSMIHLGVVYDGAGVRISIDGVEIPVEKTTFSQSGGYLGHAKPNFNFRPSDSQASIGASGPHSTANISERANRGTENLTLADPNINISQFVLYDGIYGGSYEAAQQWFEQQALERDLYGRPYYQVKTLASDPIHAPNLLICLSLDDDDAYLLGANTHYRNFADTSWTTSSTVDDGHPVVSDAAYIVQAVGTVNAQATQTAKRAYYHLEVFQDGPIDDGPQPPSGTTFTYANNSNLNNINTWLTQDFEYPNVAYISASITATDQVNSSEPGVTVLVHGKKVPVWQGGDPSNFTVEWSNNPAWVALDILCNRDYGLGGYFNAKDKYEGVDLDYFAAWADFCDEGVPDALGVCDVFGLSSSSTSRLTLYVGLIDDSGTSRQSIPPSWLAGRYVSIESVVEGGVSSGWVTKDDVLGGKNNASNRLEILSVKYETSNTGFHGWRTYAVVQCIWNRVDSEGDPLWPQNVSPNEEFYADDYSGITSLASVSGYEVRCQFDGVLNDSGQAAWDALLSVFECGRAMPVMVGNKIVPVWHSPKDPVGMFTMGNIVEGSLSVTYFAPSNFANSLEIEILDRDHDYERRTIVVDHPSIQDPTKFDSIRRNSQKRIGITRRSQATRDAYFRLNRYNLVRRKVEFSVGVDAIGLIPGDRFLLAHDVPLYGVSGRLPADAVLTNQHPGANGILSSWTQEGGDCSLSSQSLFEANAAAPPVSGYSSGVVRAYSLPVTYDGATYRLAAEVSSTGYNETPQYIGQYVARSSALYQTPDTTNPLVSPLDQIYSVDEVKEFSVYVKEPTAGASESVLVNIYRYVDEEGYVRANHGVRFDWSSGALVFGAYFGDYNGDHGSGTASPYGLSYAVSNEGSGWYRATVFYDNGAATGAGADGVGDFLQARVSFSHHSSSNESFLPSPIGRGSNLLRFGDPFNVNGVESGSSVWTKINESAGTNSIAHTTTVAPPFYAGDTGFDAGKRGYVLNLNNSQVASGSIPAISQVIAMPSDWPGSLGAGDMTDEVICATLYVRLSGTNVASNTTLYIRASTSPSTGSAPTDWYDEDYAQWRVFGFSTTPSIVFNKVETTTTITEVLSSVSAVRLTSTADDADWLEVNVACSYNTDFDNLYFLVGLAGNTGGDASVEVWGVRVHGEGGTGSTGAYVNQNTHRGLLLWGPLYNGSSSGSVTAWSDGGTIQLDRDVTLESGKSYEIYLRSNDVGNPIAGGDATEVISVSDSEVPVSGSTTIPARTDIKVASPAKFAPRTGDLYSFGETASSVEDLVVSEVELNPETLERRIVALEYVEEIYDDTAFGVISDPTISYGPVSGNTSNYRVNGFGASAGQSAVGFTVRSAPFRGNNADSKAAIAIQITPPQRVINYDKIRLYISQVNDDLQESRPVQIAELDKTATYFLYQDDSLRHDVRYRIRLQTVGTAGTCLPVSKCLYQDTKAQTACIIPRAPAVSVATDGFTQVYEVDAAQSKAVTSVEGRIGGWIISTPAYAGDPRQDTFTSLAGIAIGVTNSAGETNLPVYSRARLANGRYGIAAITDHTTSFKDFETSEEEAAEDDYSSIMAVPVGLTVTPGGVLTWQAASSLLEVNCPMTTVYDLGTARRVLPVALLQGYQVRPETLADCTFALGSETGRRWSLEGPMDDPGATKDNASVKIEWRWSSTGSVASEDWVPFRPQEVYFRTCQFRLVWTRPTADYQVRLQRFATKLYVAPKFEPEDIDGGTF